MNAVTESLARLDYRQRRNRPAAVAYGVIKKFGDDRVNHYVVALGWYGFVAIFPLLLVVVTILGYVGAASLGHRLVSTLHQFPVVGSEFNPAHGSSSLHGSALGLVVGLLGLIYGAQGVTQSAQDAMAQVWNVPQVLLPGFVPRLARSLLGLVIIGGSFVVNAGTASVVTASGTPWAVRVGVLVAMVMVNTAMYLAAFWTLTPPGMDARRLVPGAAVGGAGFTFLITLGSGLIQHQVRNSSATYGQFGVVIGLVGFLFLLAKISLYGAELNPVLARHLWPRGLVSTNPTEADHRALSDLAHGEIRRVDQRIGVGFGKEAAQEAARDARQNSRLAQTSSDPASDPPPSRVPGEGKASRLSGAPPGI
jgi:uncharacterized BrkB/YihY/UPF0761 family membrane protein